MSSSLSNEYLGSYRLLKVVNLGQSSQIWQAYDDANRRYVAIKTLQEKCLKDAEQIAFLRREYEVAGGLSHPKLVRVYQFGTDRGIPYLALEWCAAPNLKAWINKGYGQYAKYLPSIIPDMVEALTALHGAGWVHRDIKPDNYLYSEETGLKLFDFSLGRKKPGLMGKLLKFGSKKVQGTASYMSPEQILGQPVDEQADIYCFGCAMFELLGCRLPYTGGTINELLQKHLSGPIPPVTARNHNLSSEIGEIVKLCMAKNPKDRPKSSADLFTMLKKTRLFKKPPSESDIQ